jgi:alkylation response protein AidB-like acyl-CoA dehydrogenase
MTTQLDLHGLAGDPLAVGWDGLRDRGLLTADAFTGRGDELDAVRRVAASDIALGRVFDGHRNALERLLLHRPHDVPEAERVAAAAGELALGVWGADPGPNDGPPAVLVDGPSGPVLRGVKTFCSGAGLLDRAIVLVRRSAEGPPILPVLVDLRAPGTVEVDRTWFVGEALRESRSDRVVFDGAPVLAILGEEGTLTTEPWISGDALRSSAVWAGGVDAILDRLAMLGAARPLDAADRERLGRADAIRATVDVWIDAGLAAVEHAQAGGVPPGPTIGAMRLELTERIRALLRLAAELTGSRGLVADASLSRARAGLDVLLLQHRLGAVALRRADALLADGAR